MTDEFPLQRASNADNISIWWHHHGTGTHYSFWPINLVKHYTILWYHALYGNCFFPDMDNHSPFSSRSFWAPTISSMYFSYTKIDFALPELVCQGKLTISWIENIHSLSNEIATFYWMVQKCCCVVSCKSYRKCYFCFVYSLNIKFLSRKIDKCEPQPNPKRVRNQRDVLHCV